MKRSLALTALLVLTVAGVAAAAGHFATFSVDPNTAGSGSRGTLDVKPPVKSSNPTSSKLFVAKGAGFHPKAVAGRCTPAQAKNNSCPKSSKFGGGTGYATAQASGNPTKYPVQANLSLYLMKPQHQGDLASVDLVSVVPNVSTEHTIGRVFKVNTPKYGIETSFPHVGSISKPPSGFTVHVDRIVLHFGKHRTVNGKTVFLNTNPKTCNGSWPYKLVLGYPGGVTKVDARSGVCKP